MSTPKHTAGPWSYELIGDDDPARAFFAIDGPGVGKVATAEVGSSNHATVLAECVSIERAEANARLIAAAPELAEHLRALAEWIGCMFTITDQAIMAHLVASFALLARIDGEPEGGGA